MIGDKVKQKARLSIIERLRGKGMPMSPVPEAITPDQMAPEEETLNDMGLAPSLSDKLKKKKKPQSDEALTPQVVTGSY